MRDGYPPPPFGPVIPGVFIYAAWRVDPARVGPFLRVSTARAKALDGLREVAGSLAARSEVAGVNLFETTAIVPIPGAPQHDIVMLIHVRDVPSATALRGDATITATNPAMTFTARNGARFGITDNGLPGSNVLLNHFTGTIEESSAVNAWRTLSAWFVAKTGIDNSTLLAPDLSAPYVLVNYARIPGTVAAFMARQLLRPSFYRYVRPLLARHHLTSLPIFVRTIDLPGRPR
ncbi:hypothetical protein ACT17_05840 [Mycolicibacterium conceptionense]|jgi:hypothetical protein|uniref:Uncharacterized protein n=2 Tax=Mycolicibacterium TaxID=1866885 RepID=A0ABR5FQS6_9MYCO|nr:MULTISPECIES: hypothetical protein [Mycolicibacterium]KLI07140.1 hypothetical protein AA982_16650 [Mycolicibacterium senegalense]KLO50178.1 hypothetical protein ABW05_00220 [Mycolicibacterium senegalense]KMV19575.1 hypothetical protein ACT17_05840 [Mycolicibacterium conceptionense]OBK03761.1 hypothetical protein A5639_21910 [Mycolicibacterium conceptionense]OMB81874.1 hypothetical protein A5741_24635 [Mycolicibacterium conceptionense]